MELVAASAQPSHERSHEGERWLTVVVGLCAAGPVIVSTVRALHDGWVPAGDQANIATRAHDVLTSHTPLVGLHSDVSAVTHHALYSLGPMLFWLLALPAHIASPSSLALTMGLANTIAIVGAIALARRRGGRTLMFAAALAIVLMSRSLPPEALHDVWNPSAGLFGLTLLVFLCWSLGCGEHRLLPLTVLVASFLAQCQLAFVPPALGAFAVGVVGLCVSLRSAPTGVGADRPRRLWRWALAAALVAVVCWTPPAINQIEGSPGNLTTVLRAARANVATLGAGDGWHAVALAVGAPPWWLTDPAYAYERKREVRVAPSALASASALLALLALLGVAGLGALRRCAELWVGALLAVALCAGLGAVAATTPDTRLLAATLGYTMWSGSPIGMVVWLMLAWSVTAMLAGRVRVCVRVGGRMRVRERVRVLSRPVSPALAFWTATAAVAGASLAVGLAERPDEHVQEYHPLEALTASLDRAVPSGRTVQLIGVLGNATFRFKMAARYALVEHGVRPISPGTDTRVGSWYELDHHRYDCSVYVTDGSGSPVRRAALVTSVLYAATHRVSAWVAPAGCPAATTMRSRRNP